MADRILSNDEIAELEKLTVDRKDQSKVPAKYYERLGLKKPADE